MFYPLNRLFLSQAQAIEEDLEKVQRFNAQYNYDNLSRDRLKKELNAMANTMGKSNEKK